MRLLVALERQADGGSFEGRNLGHEMLGSYLGIHFVLSSRPGWRGWGSAKARTRDVMGLIRLATRRG